MACTSVMGKGSETTTKGEKVSAHANAIGKHENQETPPALHWQEKVEGGNPNQLYFKLG